MAIKLTVTRHVEKKKSPPTKLIIERVTTKSLAAKKAAAKKVKAVKKAVASKVKAVKQAVVKKVAAPKKTISKKTSVSKKPLGKEVATITMGAAIVREVVAEEVEHIKDAVEAVKKSIQSTPLSLGSPFPEFAMVSTEGGTVTRNDLLGSRYVFYFYPKDETSGCTTEAHEFSKLAEQFNIQDVRIFGVSPDSLDSHQHFIAKENITYPLLVDEGHKFASLCGVWGGLFNKRTTFVIGPDGLIERVYENVKPEGHGVCVLEDLGKGK